jgi:hypothetical protein
MGHETKERSSKSGTNDTDKNHIGTNEKGPRETYGKKTAKIEAVAERIIQEKKIRINYPPVVQAKNDRNAANPRPGSPQHIKNITAKKDPGVSLDEYKKKLANEREHIQIEYEKTMEQREALQELYKKEKRNTKP